MADSLKILIVTPTCLPDPTGNAITAHRLYKGLIARGADVRVVSASDEHAPSGFRPDVIHALHAVKGGLPACTIARETGAPVVITITGTDINIDLLRLEGREGATALSEAARIIVYGPWAVERLVKLDPALHGRIEVIRPSVDINQEGDKKVDLPAGFNFLLPSGIRRVKDPVFAVTALAALRQEFPDINLTVAGPILDKDEWTRLRAAMEGREWVSHRVADYKEMPSLYSAADVVLNTSVSEGLSNALLEAMALCRPVLASDCEGNRAVITDGVDGLLYRQGDEGDFIGKARQLVQDGSLRERLGSAAAEKAAREYCLEAEIEAHMKMYGEVMSGR
ncbi:MAG: glycosyltransferase family 4 protein [Nitrospirota bacterium]|nr:glycosyltransferase family 4 protein [Nitrospirota bacterium]